MKKQCINNHLLEDGKQYVVVITNNKAYIFINNKKYNVKFSIINELTIESSGDTIQILMSENEDIEAAKYPWSSNYKKSNICVGKRVTKNYITIFKRFFKDIFNIK